MNESFLNRVRNVLDDRRVTLAGIEKLKGIPSAVMLLLHPGTDGETEILFTLRTGDVDTHKNQVSFPGGAWEEEDEFLLDTALRETEEEIGIPRRHITCLGGLPLTYTVTGFTVLPFICSMGFRPEISPSEAEIAEVFSVPFRLFESNAPFKIAGYSYKGVSHSSFYFPYEGKVIWGATARILVDFLDRLFPGYSSKFPAVSREELDDMNRWLLRGV